MKHARLTGKSRGNEAEREDDVENAHVTNSYLSYVDCIGGSVDEFVVGVWSSG
jgi:hypothetical protein